MRFVVVEGGLCSSLGLFRKTQALLRIVLRDLLLYEIVSSLTTHVVCVRFRVDAVPSPGGRRAVVLADFCSM